jgi:hypothetical protein
MVIGPPAVVGAFRRLAARAAIPVTCGDRSTQVTLISLVGPRLRALPASVGLEALERLAAVPS